MIAELDCVRRLMDPPDRRLKRGMVGAILMIHTSPSLAYEVEFIEADGDTFAIEPHNIGLVPADQV